MRDQTPLSALSKAYHSALIKDLPGTEVANKLPSGPSLILRPVEAEIEVTHFRQIWNSSGLGFSHTGEAGLTFAYTSVISDRKNHAVYFNGMLAYVLTRPNSRFYEDLERRVLRPVSQVHYYGAKKVAA